MRHEVKAPSHLKKKWTKIYHKWLNTVKFDNPTLEIVFQEYLHTLDEIEQRLERLEKAIHTEAMRSEHAPVIEALQALRGVKKLQPLRWLLKLVHLNALRLPATLWDILD